jgi:hypothetical protein
MSGSDIIQLCRTSLLLGNRILRDLRISQRLVSSELRNLVEYHCDYADIILKGELAEKLESQDVLGLALSDNELMGAGYFAKLILRSALWQKLATCDLLTIAKADANYAEIILNTPAMKPSILHNLPELAIAHEAIFWGLNEAVDATGLKPYDWQRIMRAKPNYLLYELIGLSTRLSEDALAIVTQHHDEFIKQHLHKISDGDDTLMVNEEMLVKLGCMNNAYKEIIMGEPVLSAMLSPEMLCVLFDMEATEQQPLWPRL